MKIYFPDDKECREHGSLLTERRPEEVRFSEKFNQIINSLQGVAKTDGNDRLDLNWGSEESNKAWRQISSKFGLLETSSHRLLRLLDRNDPQGEDDQIDLSVYKPFSGNRSELAARVYASLLEEYGDSLESEKDNHEEETKKEPGTVGLRITNEWPDPVPAESCIWATLGTLLFIKK